MNRLKKMMIVLAAFTSLSLTAFSLTPAYADGTGQIEGGSGVYEIKNLTENGAYSNSIIAQPCEELQYSIRLHNSGFVAVNNINLTAPISSGASTTNTSTMTATYTDGVVPSTTTSATVTFGSAQSISYESGTTKLYDGNGNLVKTLPDGVTTSGLGLGSLNGSTTEYVNFKAKVGCSVPVCPVGDTGTPPNCVSPPPPSVVCSALVAEYIGSTNVPAQIKFTASGSASGDATINGYSFNFGDGANADSVAPSVDHTYATAGTYKATAQVKSTLGETAVSNSCTVAITVTPNNPPVVTPPVTPATPTTPTELPSTGPEAAVSGIFGTGALGFGVRQLIGSRRRLAALLK